MIGSIGGFRNSNRKVARLCKEIAELTGIEYRVLSSAFAGEEKELVLDVVKTAIAKNPQGTPEE